MSARNILHSINGIVLSIASLLAIVLTLACLCAPAAGADENQPAIDQFFFQKNFEKYEAQNKAKIREVKERIICITLASLRESITEIFESLKPFSNITEEIQLLSIHDISALKRFCDMLVNISRDGEAKWLIRIRDERAIAYESHAAKNESFFEKKAGPMKLYFFKNGQNWIFDFRATIAATDIDMLTTLKMHDESLLRDQSWLLQQYRQYDEIIKLFDGRLLPKFEEESARRLINYITQTPKSAAAHYYLSIVYFRMGYFKLAYNHIRESRLLSGGEIAIEIFYARMAILRKFGGILDEKIASIYHSDPYNQMALMVMGEYYSAKFRYDVSAEAFNAAGVICPFMTPHYHVVYSASLEKLGKFKEAADELSRCPSYGSDFYYASYMAGKMYLKAGKDELAAKEFQSVIKNLNFAETRREVAGWLMDYHLAGNDYANYSLYRRYYLMSFINSPFFVMILITLWLIYMIRKLLIKNIFIPLLSGTAYIFKNNLIHNMLFDLRVHFAQNERAISDFKAYSKKIEDRAPLIFQKNMIKLGNFFLSIYKPGEALEIFRHILACDPGCNEAILGLGLSEYDLKNYETAAQYFMSGIELEAENHFFYYYAGICNMMLDQKQNGIELITMSYKINNAFTLALSICETHYLGESKINDMVAFYDDVFTLGDVKDFFIEKYLQLHISRMDQARLQKMLNVFPSLAVRQAEAYLAAASAFREIGKNEEAIKYSLISILTSKGISLDLKKYSRRTLEILNFITPGLKANKLLSNQLLELGIAYKCAGEESNALRIFNKITHSDPNYPFVYFFLKNYKKSFELMAAQLSENNYPWNNASIVEAIYLSLKETRNEYRITRYREWGTHYARAISNNFGIFSYKYLRHVPKSKFLEIINDADVNIKITNLTSSK